jgi:hypothetical protein
LFFFAVPTSLFDSSNACVSENSYIGQKMQNNQNGKWGTLKELKGRSERCQDGGRPILAVIEYEN